MSGSTYHCISLVAQLLDWLGDLSLKQSLLMPLCPHLGLVGDLSVHEEVLVLAELLEDLVVASLSPVLHELLLHIHLE